jgi:acyl-CoA thioesterase
MLGLTFEADHLRGHFELVPAVGRHDGALYGGTAIAASVAAMEAATQRGALWVTTQYVATAQQTDVIECTTTVMASGRNVTQVQVTGRLGDKVLFLSLGSTATPRVGGLEGQYQFMPAVTPPEDTGPMTFGPMQAEEFRGFTVQVEYRQAKPLGSEATAPPLALWARLTDGRSMTPASIAFVADMVPGAIARAAGFVGGGTSLDNSLRFGSIADDHEWILLELRGQMAVGSHAHGSVKAWGRDGTLLAVGGQSANMIHMVAWEEYEKMMAEPS